MIGRALIEWAADETPTDPEACSGLGIDAEAVMVMAVDTAQIALDVGAEAGLGPRAVVASAWAQGFMSGVAAARAEAPS